MNIAARSHKSGELTNRLSGFKHSGLRLAEFCRKERVFAATFYCWNRRLHGTLSRSKRPKATLPATQPKSTLRLVGKSGSVPADGSLFVFVNRARNRMKMLHFDGKGFWLYYRVLEAGTFENLTDTGSAVLRLDATQLWMLLDGVSLVASQKRRKRYTHPAAGVSTSS